MSSGTALGAVCSGRRRDALVLRCGECRSVTGLNCHFLGRPRVCVGIVRGSIRLADTRSVAIGY
jgi:hypothetical protein